MTSGGRAITLVELLIVLAIALAIGALTFKSAVTWTDKDKLEAVQTGLSSAALEARSEALALQRPFELVAQESDRGVFRIGMIETHEHAEFLASDFEVNVEEPESRMRVLYELPAAMRIQVDDPVDFDPQGQLGSEPIVLMRLLPDGSAVLPGFAWTLSQEDRVFAPSIARWTARFAFSLRDEGDASDDPFGERAIPLNEGEGS